MDQSEIARFRELIPLYVSGAMDESQKNAMRERLSQSDELREELRFWQHARAVALIERKSPATEHVTAELLVKYAEDTIPKSDEKSRVEEHLKSCRECQADYAMIQDLFKKVDLGSPELVSRKATLHKFRHGFQWPDLWRPAFAIPAAAVVVAVIVFVLPKLEEKSSVEQRVLSLEYQSVVRGPDQEIRIPNLIVSEGVSEVSLRITIPKSGIENVLYSLRLYPPTGESREIADSLQADSLNNQNDLIAVTVKLNLPHQTESLYTLWVNEILPPGFEDLTPEEYRYQFTVSPAKNAP